MTIKIKHPLSFSKSRRIFCNFAVALLLGLGVGSIRAQNATVTAPSGDQQLSHADKHFIMKAAMASANEVALSQLAADHAASADIKSLAQMMITDHQQLNADLQTLATQKNVDISKPIQKGEAKDVDSLAKNSGQDFDKAYAKKMVGAHEDAVALFKKESTDGKDPDVMALATKYLPILSEHLQHAQTLNQSLGQ